MSSCIYCNSDDLTISDIIPFALTGAKVKKIFVCKEHNAYTNDHFEKQFISEFDFFRNALGLTTRRRNPIKYNANLKIDNLVVTNTSISNRASVYATDKRLFCGEKDGVKVLWGAIEQLKKIKGANPEPLDLKNLTVEYSFSLDKLFASEMVLHTVAKIAYEWHCLINDIDVYDCEKYGNITNYILERIQGENIVEIVVDGGVINVMEKTCELGTNSLYEYVDSDGYLYVVFNFWNVATYKVKICNTNWPNENPTTILTMYRYNIDGTKDTTVFAVCGSAHVISEEPLQALHRMKKFYIDKLEALTKTKVLSVYLVHQLISRVQANLELYKQGSINFARLLDYEDNDRVIAIQLIQCFSEHEKDYDMNISFNENLRRFFQVDEILTIQQEEKIAYLTELVRLNDNNELIPILDTGIAAFSVIWDNEINKIEQ